MNIRHLLKSLIILSLTLGLFSSCATFKKYKTIGKDYEKCKDDKASLEKQHNKLKDQYAELESASKTMMQNIKQLKKDTEQLGQEFRICRNDLKELRAHTEALEIASKQTVMGNEKEIRLLLDDIQKNKELQLLKEDELKDMANRLTDRENVLRDLIIKFREKESRVNELEAILSSKDSIVNALKRSVNDALLGYVGNGLSISVRNGKVYVSMEESLLFPSASWQVNKEGSDALKKLSRVLKDSKDINIMVEGHTDNVKFNGAGNVKDNWDLSVMRATAVAKIILDNSDIDPSRVIAAGRSEYIPVNPANTKEARAKNRRTEIILTPKLDELFKIIESN
ncbi:MAG: OmpA family protein [Bacteroidales bacterium]